MGNDGSKRDFFELEELSKISLKNRKTVSYYFISSSLQASELSKLRKSFKIDIFPSLATLKQEMSFVNRFELVKIVVCENLNQLDLGYLQQEQKVSQVITFKLPSMKGQKIIGNANTLE